MKLNYYTYSTETPTNYWHIHDFNQLLNNYIAIDDEEFKNSFEYGIDKLYLFQASTDVYLFIRTRHDELIKTVNSSDISFDDIYERLQQDEQLGFASFIILKDSHYGMASTFHGPTNNLWLEFLNQLIQKLGVADHEVISQPIMTQVPAERIEEMPFVGRTVMEFDTSNDNAVSQFKRLIGWNMQDDLPEELKGFEIVIKPRMRQNIKDVFNHLADLSGEQGLIKFKTKAKNELGDRLSEYYIIQKGQLGDEIVKGSDQRISQQIVGHYRENDELQSKVQEFLRNDKVRQEQVERLSNFHAIDNFRDTIL